MARNEIIFTVEEVRLALSLSGDLDEDMYVHDAAKSLIFKCRDWKNSGKSARILP